MNRPTQIVSIIDNGVAYAFDAVINIEYQHALKVAEEESDIKGKEHVNYAVKTPNILSLEVSVSDTVTCSNEPLTAGGGKRSVTAFQKLVEIQEKRDLLTVVTPFETLTKMLIESITAEQSADYQNEMHAQIVFKQMTVSPKKEKQTYPKKDPTEELEKETDTLNSLAREAELATKNKSKAVLGGGVVYIK